MTQSQYTEQYAPAAGLHNARRPCLGHTLSFPFFSFSFLQPGNATPASRLLSWVKYGPGKQVGWFNWLFLLFLGCLAGVYLWQDPYQATWGSYALPVQALNPAQRSNIHTAAQALHGSVIKPGENWSFNKVVGPRTERRGYQRAASYLEGDTTGSVGGGICLVSSAIYQLALKGGITVTERVPHLKTIRTVPAGLDATVWYGQADVKLHNPYPFPLMLQVQQGETGTQILLKGPEPATRIELRRESHAVSPEQVLVQLFQKQKGQWVRLTQDRYQLAP